MIICTFAELDRLRDMPGRPGPLTKLLNATEPPTIVDKFRIGRFCKLIHESLVEYGKMLEELGRKYGEPVTVQGFATYKIKPENLKAFEDERAKIDTEEVKLQSLSPLPIATYDRIPLTAGELDLLDKFVVKPEGF
jgi:hypothetical protein